jgi:hypothetical protein
MTKSEIQSFSGLVGIRVSETDILTLAENTAFQRFEQGLFDRLNQLYEELAKAGLTPLETEFVRGQILAIRFMLGLPELIAHECAQSREEPMKLTKEEIEETEDFVQRRYQNKGE